MELDVLGDRYELQEPIGRGGMATIYRAVDLRMGRTVAVKILREVYSTDPKFVTRFQREARAASALQHPNIVQVFDYGQSGESYYIVMEFVVGSDLRRYLKKQGVLTNDRAIEIAHDVGLGLGAAHKRGIVHRDVKPQNIMLNDDGLVKLTDFGIASMYKDADAERLTTTGMTLGTVQYYAPEQAQGEVVSPAADIYALGIVLYEMVCGRTPFDGDTPVAVAMRHIQDIPEPPSAINPRVSPQLERIIMRCLEKDPRDRYRDGDALAYALENIARNPAARRMTGAAPAGRPQFAPLGLPSADPRPAPNGPQGYGAAAVASGPPRGGPRSGGPIEGNRPMAAPYDIPGREPPFEPLGGDGAVATRPYGPADRTMPRSPTTGRPSGPFGAPRRPDEQKRGNGVIIGVIVSAAVLLLGLTCFLIATITGNGLNKLIGNSTVPTATATTATVPVPDFVNKNYTDALNIAQSKHLQLKPTPKADQAPKDTIIAQDPPAGTAEPYGSTVNVTVSSGPGKITIPDVSNKQLADAENQLTIAGFSGNYTVQHEINPQVSAGLVIRTDPIAGMPALPDAPITIIVSSGSGATATPTATATATAKPTCTVTPTPVGPPPTASPTLPPGC